MPRKNQRPPPAPDDAPVEIIVIGEAMLPTDAREAEQPGEVPTPTVEVTPDVLAAPFAGG